MTQRFYMEFEQATYPCFWHSGEERWQNAAAARMGEEETARIHAVLTEALREQQSAAGTARIADALRIGGITVLPVEGGLFAACPEGPKPPIQAFSASIREPLTNIYAVLPLVAKRLEDEDLVYAEEIQNNCYALLRLAANLEAAGRLDTADLRLRPIDLTAMVESLVVCTRSVCKAQGVEITRQLPQEPLVVRGDNALLDEALLNLIRNSLEFTRDGNEITVRLYKAGGRAVLQVEDKGLGIRPEHIQNIFAPYYSVDPYGDGGAAPGLGLGLAIAAHAAKALGGTITAESTFGEGTCITLALPLDSSGGEDVLHSEPADYLLNRYSAVYVQLNGFCRLPVV